MVSTNDCHFVSLASLRRAPPEALLVLPKTHFAAFLETPWKCAYLKFLQASCLLYPYLACHTLLFWVKSCILHLFSLRGGKREKKNTIPTCPQSYFNLFFLQLFRLESSGQVLVAPIPHVSERPSESCPFPPSFAIGVLTPVVKQDHKRRGFVENTWITFSYLFH